MSCTDKSIKELLPEYEERRLAPLEQYRVKQHLESCEDCRTERALLRMMREETVPDPGEAYWAMMPARVFRAVQAHSTQKPSFDLSWLAGQLTLPRWAVAAAGVGMALMISWFVLLPPAKAPDALIAKGYEVPDEIIAPDGPHLHSLDAKQIDTVSAWAHNELASMGSEAALVVPNGTEDIINEELADLDFHDAEKLSTMLDEFEQEG